MLLVTCYMDEFIKGSFGGLCGTILSHPFDTIKSRLQSNIGFKNAIKMGHFYGGLRAPIIGIPFEKSIVFGFYKYSKDNGINTFYSGVIGGLMSTLIVTPIEYVKINRQLDVDLKDIKFSLRTIYKGFLPTIFRETPGFGIYFSVYNYLNDIPPEQKSLFKSFCFGGLSGLSAWLFIYPADLIKTNIQNGNYNDVTSVIKDIYKKNGLVGFYKGFHFSAMRAIPLHAGVFLGYEWISSL